MCAGLIVYGHVFYAAVTYLAYIAPGVNYHQMSVENLVGTASDVSDYRKAESNIRDENSVHDIEMQHVDIRGVEHIYVVAKSGEVGRKK